LRDRLTEREIDAYRHPLVRFVGLDTYEAAGGGIRRDLFAEGDAGVYLTDAALLERLAQDKLAGIAAKVKAEGWAWVDATPGDPCRPARLPACAERSAARPNKREAQRIEKLQAKMHELAEAVDAALDAETRTRPMPCRKAKPGEQLQALEDGLQDYGRTEGRSRCHRHHRPQRRGRDSSRPAARSRSQGAAHAGTLRQGFGSEGEAGNDDEGEDDEQPKTAAMSDRLAQRLSAHRTAALQIEVARHPQVALAAWCMAWCRPSCRKATTATTCRWA
jgi:ParB family chromosome partitioning protein